MGRVCGNRHTTVLNMTLFISSLAEQENKLHCGYKYVVFVSFVVSAPALGWKRCSTRPLRSSLSWRDCTYYCFGGIGI